MAQVTRKSFMKGMFAAGSAPMLFAGCANGFFANRKINVALIGCGRISSEFEMPCILKRPDAARLVANLRTVTDRLERSEGTLGRLVSDGALHDELSALVKDLRQIVDNYRDTTPISTFGSLIGGAL